MNFETKRERLRVFYNNKVKELKGYLLELEKLKSKTGVIDKVNAEIEKIRGKRSKIEGANTPIELTKVCRELEIEIYENGNIVDFTD